MLPSYSGFYASLTKPTDKQKAHFHIKRSCGIWRNAKMPFVQLIGDQPVYALIEEVEHGYPVLSEKILPVLGGFYTACTFLARIYRRFKGLGLEDIAISAGIV